MLDLWVISHHHVFQCVPMLLLFVVLVFCFFFFQAEDGIRDLVRSRGLGDVYKRQTLPYSPYQNAKQESFWGRIEGRLMAMLEGEALLLSLIHI